MQRVNEHVGANAPQMEAVKRAEDGQRSEKYWLWQR